MRIWAISLLLLFIYAVGVQEASAGNSYLCEADNPVSPAILKQYGIDDTVDIYQDRTSDVHKIVPLRYRTETVQQIIDNAVEGSMVIFEPGFYDIQGTINIDKSLTIVAKNHWLGGAAGRTRLLNTRFKVNADNVTIEGFEFRYGHKTTNFGNSRDGAIDINGDNTLIISNRFFYVGVNSLVSDYAGVTIQVNGARGTKIEGNSFEVNYGVAIKTDDYVRETIIRRNDFVRTSKTFWVTPPTEHPTAGEVAHLGNAQTTFDGEPQDVDSQGTIFERNLITGWQVEMELLSIKSDFNIIRENLGIDNGIGSFVVRMGHNNLVKDNILIGTTEQPLRVSGSGNRFENNFFAVKNDGEGYLLALHRQMRYPNSTHPDCGLGCFSYLASRMNTFIKNTFVGYGKAIVWLDVTHQERLYTDGNVEYVPDDPLPAYNLFAQNSIYSANSKNLSGDLDTSIVIDNLNSEMHHGWDCASVPNFNFP